MKPFVAPLTFIITFTVANSLQSSSHRLIKLLKKKSLMRSRRFDARDSEPNDSIVTQIE